MTPAEANTEPCQDSPGNATHHTVSQVKSCPPLTPDQHAVTGSASSHLFDAAALTLTLK